MLKLVEVRLDVQASAYLTDAIASLEKGIANIEAEASDEVDAANKSAPVREELEKMKQALALSNEGLGAVYFVGRKPD